MRCERLWNDSGVQLSLIESLRDFSVTSLMVERPSMDKLDRSIRKLEKMADNSISLDDIALPEILDQTLTALAANQLPSRKVTKIMAMAGLPDLVNSDHGEQFVDRFLTLISEQISAIYLKYLLLGYLRFAGGNEWLTRTVRTFIKKRSDLINNPWKSRVESYNLLETEPGTTLAKLIINGEKHPEDLLSQAGLTGSLKTTGFAREVFHKLCLELSQGHNNNSLDRFWMFVDSGENPLFQESIKDYSSALLTPYGVNEADDDVRKIIQRFMTNLFGDPRIHPARWKGVSDEHLAVMYRWLTKNSFDILLKVVERSNDTTHWSERRKFWYPYIEAGHISEAWVAFGHNAASIARALVRDGTIATAREFGLLGTGGDPWHSVIMMKMGDHVIAEWTHSGKVRFYNKRTNQNAPAFYKGTYSGTSYRDGLRNDHAPDFFKIHNKGWQRDVRQYIERNIGVRL